MTEKTVSKSATMEAWFYALGYFASYVPYAALTKALTDENIAHENKVTGFSILPISVTTSLLVMVMFFLTTGWWKVAHRMGPFRIPTPTRWTFASGLCSAAIVATTTLAYSFGNTSIMLMMLFLRGGVLAIAPVMDFWHRKKIPWNSWLALGIALIAVLVVSAGGSSYRISTPAAVNVGVYLLSYFLRLHFMSKEGKSNDIESRKKYFVEEQMVATPVLLLMLLLWAWLGHGAVAGELHKGLSNHGTLLFWCMVAIGFFSQGTGIFGGLLLLSPRENTFAVSLNRASSLLAGFFASAVLQWMWLVPMLKEREIIGSAIIVGAVALLAWPTHRNLTTTA